MKKHFESQTIKDFSTTKEYWNKQKATIVLKSDKSSSSQPTCLLLDNFEISDNLAIDAFNGFFTNISSNSVENHDSCLNYINNLICWIEIVRNLFIKISKYGKIITICRQ